MVLFNHATRELTAKVVYYGPGLGGKTTNLRLLQERLERGTAGKLLSLSTAQDRTIYFDLLPVELGNIKGYTVRFQLCTVPGQVFYNETRKLVLKGVDGLVFVVDSQWSMLSHNLESFSNLQENLAEAGISLSEIPVVVQFNKRDIPGVLPVKALQDSLGFGEFPYVEAVASQGTGVVETFKLASKLTFVHLLKKIQKPGFLDPADAVEEDAMAEKEGRTARIEAPVGDDSSWLRAFRGRPSGASPVDEVFPAEEAAPPPDASFDSPETVSFLAPAVPPVTVETEAARPLPEAPAAPAVPAALVERLEALEARTVELSASLAGAVSDVSTRSELERVQRVEDTARLMDRLLAATREEALARISPLGERVEHLEPLGSELEALKGAHAILSDRMNEAGAEAGALRVELASVSREAATLREQAASLGDEVRGLREEVARLASAVDAANEAVAEASRRAEAAEGRSERLVAALRAALSADGSRDS